MYHSIDRGLLSELVIELRNRVTAIRGLLVTFRSNESNIEPLAKARRLAHMLKGDASLAGLSSVSHVAFFQESVLDTILVSGDRRTDGLEVMDELSRAMDAIVTSAESFLSVGKGNYDSEREALTSAAITFRRFDRQPEHEDHAEVARLLEPLLELLSNGVNNGQSGGGENDVWSDHVSLFRDEARQHLHACESSLSALAVNGNDHDALNELRRNVHCIKGSASVVGEQRLADLSHRVENLFDRIDSNECSFTPDVHGFISFALDVMGELTDGHQSEEQLRIFDEWYDRLTLESAEGKANGPSRVNANIEEIFDSELAESNISPELAEVFAEEAKDHVKTIYAGLESLKGDGSNRNEIQNVRRATHTLKGAAGAVGLKLVARLAHRMEDLLDVLFNGQVNVTPELSALMFATTDILEDLSLNQAEANEVRNGFIRLFREYDCQLEKISCRTKEAEQSPQIKTQLSEESVTIVPTFASVQGEQEAPETEKASESSTKQNRTSQESGQFLRVSLERLDDLVRVISEIIINRTSFEQRMLGFATCVDELKRVLGRLRGLSREMETRYSVDALRERKIGGHDGASLQQSRFRLDGSRFQEFDALEFDRYSEIHLLARSLAEATNDVGTISSELKTVIGDFDSMLDRQGRLSRDAQDRLMHIRMVPLATIATRLSRAVRVVATNRRKNAELVIQGGDTELDKTVLEEIADPLLHLVRNAVDHGVESPDVRVAKGKPATATIRIHSFHQGTQAVIRISDDGNGLDANRIRSVLVRDDHLSASDAESLTDQQLYRYIFLPGFSTAAEVSEISGRGVGMDIVRDKVEKLKGSISVESTPGKGTTFTIRLPLTLAIARSLMVVVQNETYAIPMQAVTQILRLKSDTISRLGDKRMVQIGGNTHPLLSLGNFLGVAATENEETDAVPVLIVQAGDRQIALSVNRILAGRDIVIKGLGNHLKRVPGLIGCTFLGDGTVVPILDPAHLVDARDAVTPHQRTPVRTRETRHHDDSLTVMVVDDSVSVRRVMMNVVKNAGWNPLSAKDGVDAMEILQSLDRKPDAFLLDIEMPRMDGYELLSNLRGQAEFRRTPIVMVTSRSGDKHRQKALDLGASGYIVKPFQDDAVVNLIRTLVRESRVEALV